MQAWKGLQYVNCYRFNSDNRNSDKKITRENDDNNDNQKSNKNRRRRPVVTTKTSLATN